MTIEWGDLRIFQNAVRAGGYSTAARRLGIDRTTVGRRITRLETAVGRSLWEQGQDGPRPTIAGKAVLKAAARMEQAMGRLAQDLELSDDAISGARVRIAGTAGIAGFILPQLVARLGAGAPSLELVGGYDAMLAVAQRQADIGIALARNRLRLLAGKSPGAFEQALYVAGQADCARMQAVARQRVGYGHAMLLANPQPWAKLNAPADAALEVDSLPVLHNAVAAGFGAAWLWSAVADRQPFLERLPDLCPSGAKTNIWVVHRADVAIEPGVELVRREIFSTIAGMLYNEENEGRGT